MLSLDVSVSAVSVGNYFEILKTFVCSVWLVNTAQAIWYHLWPISVYLFAVAPGGRGTNGNPLIIFPEFPAFDELQEDEIQNVLGYLTSVPRYLYPFKKKKQHIKQNLSYKIKNGQRKIENCSLYCPAR